MVDKKVYSIHIYNDKKGGSIQFKCNNKEVLEDLYRMLNKFYNECDGEISVFNN